MKKSILFIFVIGILSFTTNVMSQSIQLSDDSGIVANGKNFYMEDSCASMSFTRIHVTNISSGSLGYRVKKIETSLVAGASCSMCWGNCYGSGTYTVPPTSKSPITIASNATDASFVGDYNPGGSCGESIITYVFFNAASVNDSAWILVHYITTCTGINELNQSKFEISNAFPNPAVGNTSINYSLPQNTVNAKCVVTNILGSKVIEMPVNNQKGTITINTEVLNSGIYFYSFYVNSQLISTKKLMVK